MKKIVTYFIDNSFLVNILSAMMIIVGIISFSYMKRDLISAWSQKRIDINTSLPGAAPAQIEKFVTYPIEQAIKNIAGIEKIRSRSGKGWMWIGVSVKDEILDIKTVEDKVKDIINNLKSSLPNDLDDIKISNRKMTKGWFLNYAITGVDETNDDHQVWYSKFIRRYKNIPGIVETSSNFRFKQLYIKLDYDKLSRYRLSTSQVYRSITDAFRLYPLGSIQKGSDTFLVEMENDKLDLDSIKQIVVKANSSGHQVILSDIAVIERKISKKNRITQVNGKNNIWLDTFKDLDFDTISLKDKVETFIAKEQLQAPEGVEFILAGDGASFIQRQIVALKSNAIFGSVLVIFTLMFFLGFKNSLMTSFGLPLSYGFTFFVLESMGLKLDIISVIGMLLVLGILVDDAIIISEQYTQNLEAGQLPREAAVNAVMETWIPITGTVLTTVVAFLPILMGRDSLSGILMAIPVVVVASLGVSLFECFFILPNHLAHFVKKAKTKEKSQKMEALKSLYKRALSFTLKLRYIILASFIAIMGGTFYFASENIPMNFNLDLNSEKIRFLAHLKKTNSLEDSKKQTQFIADKLNTLDKTRYDYMDSRIGRFWANGREYKGAKYVAFTVRFSQLDENIEENKKYVENFLNAEIKNFEKTGLFEKIEITRQMDGNNESKKGLVELKLSSQSSFEVQGITDELKVSLNKVKGMKNIELDDSSFVDSWTFIPNKKKLYEYGLSMSSVAFQLRQYIRKNKVYDYKGGPEIISIYSYAEEGEAQNLKSLSNKELVLANGQKVKTSLLGEWKLKRKQEKISHYNLKRSFTIEMKFDDKLTTKEKLIKDVALIAGVFSAKYPQIDFKAQDADEQYRKNKSSMSRKVLYSMLAIFFVLAIILKSVTQPLLICLAIPFGLIGVLWSFYFQGLELDIMALIGVIGMAGVVVNDSLLLVDTINKLKRKAGFFSKDQIVNGAMSRLRPILLTSITTLGGVFPMAYGIGGDSGFTKPLAMSMGWGLLFATSLTLFVLPCLLNVQEDVISLVLKLKNKIAPGKSLLNDEVMGSQLPSELFYSKKDKEKSSEQTIQ